MRNINYKKIILVLGIIIVLNLFFNYGIETFYDGPEYDDFCAEELRSVKYNAQEDCEAVGGFWTESQALVEFNSEGEPISSERSMLVKEQIKEPSGWCDVDHTCRKEFEVANNLYKRNVFIILIVLGILSIIAGFFFGQSEAVALGFSFGGILSLIIGTIRYWSAMDDYLRFIVLAIALAALIWLGIKKIRD